MQCRQAVCGRATPLRSRPCRPAPPLAEAASTIGGGGGAARRARPCTGPGPLRAAPIPAPESCAAVGLRPPGRRGGRRAGTEHPGPPQRAQMRGGGRTPCLSDAAPKAAGPAIPRAPPAAPLGSLIKPRPEPALIALCVVQPAELFPRHAVEAGRLSLDPAPDLPAPRRPAPQGTLTCRSSFPRPRGACAQRPRRCDLRCASAGHLIRQARPAGTPLSRPARPSEGLRPATGRRPNRAGLP